MKKKNKGFTLIELITTIALMSIFFLAIMSMFKPLRTIFFQSLMVSDYATIREDIYNQITGELKYVSEVSVVELNQTMIDGCLENSSVHCLYTNDDKYLSRGYELLYPQAFYGDFLVDLHFKCLDESATILEIELNILNKDGVVLDESSTAIELRNLKTSISVDDTEKQILIYE